MKTQMILLLLTKLKRIKIFTLTFHQMKGFVSSTQYSVQFQKIMRLQISFCIKKLCWMTYYLKKKYLQKASLSCIIWLQFQKHNYRLLICLCEVHFPGCLLFEGQRLPSNASKGQADICYIH